jgi:hypothetical protein
MNKATYSLVIRDQGDRLPPEQRLRSLLKTLKRFWNFQCLEVGPVNPTPQAAREAAQAGSQKETLR